MSNQDEENLLAKIGKTLPGEAFLIIAAVNGANLGSFNQNDTLLVLLLASILITLLTFVSKLAMINVQVREIKQKDILMSSSVGYALFAALQAFCYCLALWGETALPDYPVIGLLSTILGLFLFGLAVYIFPKK